MKWQAPLAALGAVAALTIACTGPYDEAEIDEAEPVVTDPVATEPVVTEPIVTDPVVTEPAAGAVVNAEVADISGDPLRWSGQRVVVVSEVDEVYGPRAFKLDDQSPLEGGIDNDLLVFAPQGGAVALDAGWDASTVRVTGTVRVLRPVELERELGWDLDPEVEVEIGEGEPVVVATEVTRVVAPGT